MRSYQCNNLWVGDGGGALKVRESFTCINVRERRAHFNHSVYSQVMIATLVRCQSRRKVQL